MNKMIELQTLNNPMLYNHDHDHEHEHYDNFFQYVLSILGFTVGFGSLWRFPYLIYYHGGGVFLIPYITFITFFGLPLLYLEAAVGQMHQRSIPKIYYRVHKGLKMVGYIVIFTSYGVAMYYNILLAYSYRLVFTSFSNPLPFVGEQLTENTYFVQEVLDKSTGIQEFGEINWQLVFLYVLSLVVVYQCIKRGLKIGSRILILTVIVPYFFLIMMAVRGWFLSGSEIGIKYLFEPDWSELLGFYIWLDAMVQVFLQFSIATGGILNYSTRKPRNYPFLAIMYIVPIGILVCGLLSGMIIFMYVGHYCYERQVLISDLNLSGIELAFNVIPKAIGILPWANLILFTFSIVLILLGIDSMFGFVYSIMDTIVSEFRNRRPIIFGVYITQERLKLLTMMAFGILTPLFCSSAGIHYLEFFDIFVCCIGLPLGALLELLVFVYIFKFEHLSEEVEKCTGEKTPAFIKLVIESKFVIVTLSCICIIGVVKQIIMHWTYSGMIYILGWAISLYPFIIAYVYWYNRRKYPYNISFYAVKSS